MLLANRICILLLSSFVLTQHSLTPVHAQCMLANPSFELVGSGGYVFAGWDQFGVVGSGGDATHGVAAARILGWLGNGWDVSGYWQRVDSVPGDRWVASVRAWHTATNPLTGSCRALLNIEWRDAAEQLISFESHTAADASTVIGEVQHVTVTSGPAPAGTVSTRFVLMLLQAPGDLVAAASFDEAAFNRLGPPSLDESQWLDFPGGNALSFSGRTWRIKGPGVYGPGPNRFCDTPTCVWVDASGLLHLTIQSIAGVWNSTEVTLEEPLGYGDYVFTTRGRLDLLDANVVLGLFLWQYGQCWDAANGWWNPYNEIDVEYGRWGDTNNDLGQFVAQPYDFSGNIERYDANFGQEEVTSHAFRWLPDRVEFRSWRGTRFDEFPENMIHAWTYSGPHIPRPEQPRVHLNLWQLPNAPGVRQEVVFEEFHFQAVGTPSSTTPAHFAAQLLPPHPNPFNPRTTIRFTLAELSAVTLRVYDVRGRLVRTLLDETMASGPHSVVWDVQDGDGARQASGLYTVQLQVGDARQMQKVVMLK